MFEKAKAHLENRAKVIDFSKYKQNNWIKKSAQGNKNLLSINAKGGAIWINPAGEIFFRRDKDEAPSKLANDKAKMVISNFLDQCSILLFKGSGTGENAIPPDIANNEVHMVLDKFTPFTLNEFYSKDGLSNYPQEIEYWDYTSRPTEYKKDSLLNYNEEVVNKLIKKYQ